MFKLFKKEPMEDRIMRGVESQSEVFRAAARADLDKLKSSDPATSIAARRRCKKKYLDAVVQSILGAGPFSNMKMTMQINMVLAAPHKCGYDIKLSTGLMAGDLYAVCYFADTKQVAPREMWAHLNKRQQGMMDAILSDLGVDPEPPELP